ncbi:PA14 domain-containing protein [Synechococcus sp. MIT S1220]|uniref:PA14 domain-containing protein n=1 Tax=Synechococcus sp. MIT S1220 TaxID=3082549 RepID=UPI0039AEA660
MTANKPVISLAASWPPSLSRNAVEGSKGWFTINVTGGEIGPQGLYVPYTILKGSGASQIATVGEDYYAPKLSLNKDNPSCAENIIFLPEGTTSKKVYIAAIADAIAEGDETATISLNVAQSITNEQCPKGNKTYAKINSVYELEGLNQNNWYYKILGSFSRNNKTFTASSIISEKIRWGSVEPDSFQLEFYTRNTNNNALVGGHANYQVFRNGIAYDVNDDGKYLSDANTDNYNVIRAVYTPSRLGCYFIFCTSHFKGAGFELLARGTGVLQGKYLIWVTNATGEIIGNSGWITADQASERRWESKFNMDINGDGWLWDGSSSSSPINDNNVLLKNYHLIKNGKLIELGYSDAYSKDWDFIAAINIDSGFQILAKGTSSYEGKYNIWYADSNAAITGTSGWKEAQQATELGWETKFNIDIDGNGIIDNFWQKLDAATLNGNIFENQPNGNFGFSNNNLPAWSIESGQDLLVRTTFLEEQKLKTIDTILNSTNNRYYNASQSILIQDKINPRSFVPSIKITPKNRTGISTIRASDITNVASFDVHITSEPREDVSIAITSQIDSASGPAAAETISTLTFNKDNWSEAQTVVTGVINSPTTITATATSDDSNYNAIQATQLLVPSDDTANPIVNLKEGGNDNRILPTATVKRSKKSDINNIEGGSAYYQFKLSQVAKQDTDIKFTVSTQYESNEDETTDRQSQSPLQTILESPSIVQSILPPSGLGSFKRQDIAFNEKYLEKINVLSSDIQQLNGNDWKSIKTFNGSNIKNNIFTSYSDRYMWYRPRIDTSKDIKITTEYSLKGENITRTSEQIFTHDANRSIQETESYSLITIPAESDSTILLIPTIDDAYPEGDQSITVSLLESDSSSYLLGKNQASKQASGSINTKSLSSTTATIRDNDSAGINFFSPEGDEWAPIDDLNLSSNICSGEQANVEVGINLKSAIKEDVTITIAQKILTTGQSTLQGTDKQTITFTADNWNDIQAVNFKLTSNPSQSGDTKGALVFTTAGQDFAYNSLDNTLPIGIVSTETSSLEPINSNIKLKRFHGAPIAKLSDSFYGQTANNSPNELHESTPEEGRYINVNLLDPSDNSTQITAEEDTVIYFDPQQSRTGQIAWPDTFEIDINSEHYKSGLVQTISQPQRAKDGQVEKGENGEPLTSTISNINAFNNSNRFELTDVSKNATVQWDGYLYIPYSGQYTFNITRLGGASLKIDGQTLHNDLDSDFTDSTTSQVYNGEADTFVPIEIDYKPYANDPSFALQWDRPAQNNTARFTESVPSKYFSRVGDWHVLIKKGKDTATIGIKSNDIVENNANNTAPTPEDQIATPDQTVSLRLLHEADHPDLIRINDFSNSGDSLTLSLESSRNESLDLKQGDILVFGDVSNIENASTEEISQRPQFQITLTSELTLYNNQPKELRLEREASDTDTSETNTSETNTSETDTSNTGEAETHYTIVSETDSNSTQLTSNPTKDMVANANNKKYQVLDEFVELNLDNSPEKLDNPIKITLNNLNIDSETFSADLVRSDDEQTEIILPQGQQLSFVTTNQTSRADNIPENSTDNVTSESANSDTNIFTIKLLEQVTLGPNENANSITFTPDNSQVWNSQDTNELTAESSLDQYEVTLKVDETNQNIPNLNAGTVLDFFHYTDISQALNASLDPYCTNFDTVRFSLLTTGEHELESDALVTTSVIDVSDGEGLSASSDLITLAKSYLQMPDGTQSLTVIDDQDKAGIVIGQITSNGQVISQDSGQVEGINPINLNEGGSDYVGHIRLNSQPIANVTVYLEVDELNNADNNNNKDNNTGTDNGKPVRISNDFLIYDNISIQSGAHSNNTLVKSTQNTSQIPNDALIRQAYLAMDNDSNINSFVVNKKITSSGTFISSIEFWNLEDGSEISTPTSTSTSQQDFYTNREDVALLLPEELDDQQTQIRLEKNQSLIAFTFTPENWDEYQRFSITPEDDEVVDGDQDINVYQRINSEDPEYKKVTSSNKQENIVLSLVSQDDDQAGVKIHTKTNVIGEDENGYIDVALDSQPRSNVTLELAPSDSQFTVNDEQLDQADTITFTPDDWDIKQTIRLKAYDDTLVEDITTSRLLINVNSEDEAYTSIQVEPVPVEIVDNDLPTASIVPIENTQEDGDPGKFRVELSNPAPSSSGSDGIVVQYTVSTSSLSNTSSPNTFAENAQFPNTTGEVRIAPGQTSSDVFVIPIDDRKTNDDRSFTVELVEPNVASGTDANYQLDPNSGRNTATMKIINDDVAGFYIMHSGVEISAQEGGQDAAYFIGLTAQPENDVIVEIDEYRLPQPRSGAANDTSTTVQQIDSIQSSTITFAPDKWFQPQTITVKAFDDNIIEDGILVDRPTDPNQLKAFKEEYTNDDNSNRKGDQQVLDLLTYDSDTGEFIGGIPTNPNQQAQNGIHPAALKFTFSSTNGDTVDAKWSSDPGPGPDGEARESELFTQYKEYITIQDKELDRDVGNSISESLKTLQNEISDYKLPFIGASDQKTGSFFYDFSNTIADKISNLNSLSIASIEKLINQEINYWLNTDGDHVTIDLLDDEDHTVNINLDFNYSKRLEIPLDANFGIPSLGLKTKGDLNLKCDVTGALDLYIPTQNDNKGPYIKTADLENENDKGSYIQATLEANLGDEDDPFTFTGGLGFLQFDAKDAESERINDQSTNMNITLNAIITDPNAQQEEPEQDNTQQTNTVANQGTNPMPITSIKKTRSQRKGLKPNKNTKPKPSAPIKDTKSIQESAEPDNSANTGSNQTTQDLQPEEESTESDDNRMLPLSKLSTKAIDVSIDGGAAISFKTTTSAGGSKAVPSLLFDVAANLPLPGTDEPKTLFVSNVNLDLGSFVTDLGRPVISQIDSILNPLYPVVDALYTDTQIFGKIGLTGTLDQDDDGRVVVMELIQWFTNLGSRGGVKSSRQKKLDKAIVFLDQVKSLMDLVREYETMGAQGDNYLIPFGDYEYTFSSDENDKLTEADSNEESEAEKEESIERSINSKKKKNSYVKIFNKMKEIGISIPLIEDPSSISSLLTGGTTDILKWTLSDSDATDATPSFNINSALDLRFPMGPINGIIKGNFNAHADLSFGLDTRGFEQWKDDDFNLEDSWKVFANGFYVDDQHGGVDSPEFQMNAGMGAGAGLNAFIARAELTGGIEAAAQLDLIDVGELSGNSDGKIYADEIANRINNPLSLFEIVGDLAAYLEARIQVGIDLWFVSFWKTVWEKKLARIPIFKFGIGGRYGSGTASNGHLEDSTIFFDVNSNGWIDSHEPSVKTGEDGYYLLDLNERQFDTNQNGQIDPSEGHLTAIGGIDSTTGLPLEIPFIALIGEMISPLTTLYALAIELGYEAVDADEQIRKLFSLGEFDYLNDDPLADLKQRKSVDHPKVQDQLSTYIAHSKIHLNLDLLTKVIDVFSKDPDSGKISFKLDIAKTFTHALFRHPEKGEINNKIRMSILETIKSLDQTTTKQQQQFLYQAASLIAQAGVELDAKYEAVLKDGSISLRKIHEIKQVAFETYRDNIANLLDGIHNISDQQARSRQFQEKIQESAKDFIEITQNDIVKIGHKKDEQIIGKHGNDVVHANAGSDVLKGRAGNDYLKGGSGRDTIDGGVDDDILYGGRGIDSIQGNEGDDFIKGGNGSDVLKGHTGQDHLIGGGNNDKLKGGQDDDKLTGKSGHDRLFGDEGHDVLVGGPGNDLLDGGSGDDFLKGGQGRDKFVLSTGKDIIKDFDANQGDTIKVDPALELTFSQKGDNLILKAGDNIMTTFMNLDDQTLINSDSLV